MSMPYQPILLRLLHGVMALLTLLALLSGFWVYNTYDGRWGTLPLPSVSDIQGIHGTIALVALLLFPFFVLYSFHLGDRRLIQPTSLRQLYSIGQPASWLALHRIANTVMLLVLTFAVLTGRMMKEEWLPAGEKNHGWYLAHLVAWGCVFLSLGSHLLLGAKVGGLPLLRSMFSRQMRSEDRPHSWWRGLKLTPSTRLLQGLEVIIILGIVAAFVLPAFSS